MRIAIVSNDVQLMKNISEVIETFYKKENLWIDITSFSYGGSVIACMEEKQNFDVYILDIEIKDVGGLMLAERIRKKNRYAIIIFVSEYEKYAIRGYKYQAFAFWLKRTYKKEIIATLKKIKLIHEDRKETFYTISTCRYYETFPVSEIMYLEKVKKYTYFYHKRGYARERATLEVVYQRLPKESFVYINQGQIVNVKYICQVKCQEVFLINGTQLHISRNMIGTVKKILSL